MTAAETIVLPLVSDPYGDVALGVECAWPVLQLAIDLAEDGHFARRILT